MDANGTRYHLLQGGDWGRCTRDSAGNESLATFWAPGADLTQVKLVLEGQPPALALQPEVFQFVPAERDSPPTLDQRRGAARDINGNWYWIGPGGDEILVLSSGSGVTTSFWSAREIVCDPAPQDAFVPLAAPAPPSRLRLAGLAVTEDQYLVVGLLEPASLLVFDLFAGGPPDQRLVPSSVGSTGPDSTPPDVRWLTVPPELRFVPFDMAPRPGGGVWVLDSENSRYWGFDRNFSILSLGPAAFTLGSEQLEEFQPAGSGVSEPRRRGPVVVPGGVSLEEAIPGGAVRAIAIEGLPDGTVLILDQDPSGSTALIHHLSGATRIGTALSTEAVRPLLPGTIRPRLLRGHDFAFVPVPPDGKQVAEDGWILRGQLYVASAEGNQVFAFDVWQQPAPEGAAPAMQPLRLEPLEVYLPMRLFGGKAIVAAGRQVFYDFDARWLPLAEQRRPRHVEAGTAYTPVLDGREPDCTWHRLFFDACLPAGTIIVVRSRAANRRDELLRAAWQQEPAPYRRSGGSELPYVASEPGFETFELLFQAAQGRYCQLEITLKGSRQTTPRVRAARAYYGRFSYLTNYLPAIYREDERSASFLDRFLANFEGVFTDIEDRVAAAQVLFDPSTAPSEALSWLAGWFGVALDRTWEDERRRMFIRHAARFFAIRGTIDALHAALQLAFGQCLDERLLTAPIRDREIATGIRIIENFRTRQTAPVALGDPTVEAGLREIPKGQLWQPNQGGGPLQARWSEYLKAHGLEGQAPATWSPTPPANRAAWEQFSREALGFVPESGGADAWHAFLSHRYPSVTSLNLAYGRIGSQAYPSFEAVPLPAALPADGPALLDWYIFQSAVLPARRTAHSFRVLLPMPRSDRGEAPVDEATQAQRVALARRVLELEKPAHTVFDVKFYWALFRVGEARLGYDTLIDLGSRSPNLLRPAVLGQTYLAESHLASAHTPPAGRHYLGGDYR